jgi:hypothetical protein
VRDEQRSRITLEPTQQKTIGLWPWWTVGEARVTEFKTRLHERWRRCVRFERAVEHDEREVLLLLRRVNQYHSKVFHAVPAEIAGRSVWMVVRHGFPRPTVPGSDLFDVVRALAVFVRGEAIFRVSSEPGFQNPLLLCRQCVATPGRHSQHEAGRQKKCVFGSQGSSLFRRAATMAPSKIWA